MARASLVSVVMPTLNQARYIEESIRSVLSQDFEVVELVIMDGGSTDGTLELLAAIAAESYGKVRWYSQTDDGPAQAVNRAVKLARGEIVGWLNSDDVYANGAISRATEYLSCNASCVMVYGEARHIDARGNDLGLYPTQRPDTPLGAFADGCFICQPSAFFRRDVYVTLGGLDESLKASFDFDLWIRFFRAFPGRIGWLRDVQALSRLHEDGITIRARQAIAFEGLKVIRKHLGDPPAHWLLTHFAELCESHPFEQIAIDLGVSFRALVAKAANLLSQDVIQELHSHIDGDRQLALSTPDFHVSVSADGWAGKLLEVRVRHPDIPHSGVTLECQHVARRAGLLRIDVCNISAGSQSIEVWGAGRFEIDIKFTEQEGYAREIHRIVCEDTFVPADSDPGSQDRRQLAYRVEACRFW